MITDAYGEEVMEHDQVIYYRSRQKQRYGHGRDVKPHMVIGKITTVREKSVELTWFDGPTEWKINLKAKDSHKLAVLYDFDCKQGPGKTPQ